MPKKAKPPQDPNKREHGFLWCDACETVVPYHGFSESHRDGGWPMHRCTATHLSEIRPFQRWTKTGPEIQSFVP